MNKYNIKSIIFFIFIAILFAFFAIKKINNSIKTEKNVIVFCKDLKQLEIVGQVTNIKYSTGKGAFANIWIKCSQLNNSKNFPNFNVINDSIVKIAVNDTFARNNLEIGSKVLKSNKDILFYFISNSKIDSLFLFESKFNPYSSSCK